MTAWRCGENLPELGQAFSCTVGQPMMPAKPEGLVVVELTTVD